MNTFWNFSNLGDEFSIESTGKLMNTTPKLSNQYSQQERDVSFPLSHCLTIIHPLLFGSVIPTWSLVPEAALVIQSPF